MTDHSTPHTIPHSTSNPELEQVRAKIDAIDLQIQTLLNQRAQCALTVAEVKLKEAGDPAKVQIYRPEREAQVLQQVMARNSGPLDGPALAIIFREIMSACRALEKPTEVAFLGPLGTFSHAAALKQFGHSIVPAPQSSISDVFARVESGQCPYGVVPVENSTEGMVSLTLDRFATSPLRICGELELRIELHLLINSNTDPKNIRRIYSHQQPLAQARHWLDTHWPNVERIAVSSNGEAARLASEQDDVAAVAGTMAADQYGLVKLTENIEDIASNTTRFMVIGRDDVPASGNDKTSVVVSAHNKPGALFTLLEPFKREGVSLTRIDTRPSRAQNWAYLFFIEFEGHRSDPKIAAILRELEEKSIMLKILGSYPKAVI